MVSACCWACLRWATAVTNVSGTIRLDVPTTATIYDLSANSLVDLPYTDGQIYIILGIKVYLPSITQ